MISALAAIGQLQDVNGLWYNTKTFVIDGYRFINCRFDSCQLTVLSSRFELINCFVDDNTQFLYGSDPMKIVRLWNSRNNAIYTSAPIYAPQKNTDGTITVKGA